ncbi:MAG: arylsulfatase [Planctomycetota bacterium]
MTGLVVSRSALADRPNVVIVMADDMGFSDIGCFGSEIETPNLDRLASRGVRLTQFYNTGKCCPSRASLLTGLYPHQAGVGWMVSGDLGRPGYRGDLNKRCVTLAEVLGSAGYRCYMTGKWHVTPWDYKRDQGPTHNWPLQRGFDHCLATINGSGNYFGQGSLVRDNVRTKIDPPRYYTDIISDQAADYVRLAADSKDPFLLYVAYTAPHFPLHAKTNDIAKYLGRYMDGWQSIRQQRFARMLDLGLVDRSWKLSPSDAPDWNRLSDDQKILWDKRMAVYAAQIDCMDQGIGRLIEALQQSGQLENTLVLFLSDNGGCAELKNRSDRSLGALGTRRSYESYRREWANVSNTPFRRYKRYAHEGGIATPLLASWPQSIKPRKTPVRDPAHIVDIMATCVDVAQVDYPMQFSGNTITPMEGISLRPLLEGKSLPRPHPLCWDYEGNRAIRDRDWKLVADGLLGAWELYDLKTDRTETTNLASIHPEIVEELSSKWTAWAKRCDVLPLDGRTKAARLGSAVPPAE